MSAPARQVYGVEDDVGAIGLHLSQAASGSYGWPKTGMKVYRVDTDEQVHQQIDALPAEALSFFTGLRPEPVEAARRRGALDWTPADPSGRA